LESRPKDHSSPTPIGTSERGIVARSRVFRSVVIPAHVICLDHDFAGWRSTAKRSATQVFPFSRFTVLHVFKISHLQVLVREASLHGVVSFVVL